MTIDIRMPARKGRKVVLLGGKSMLVGRNDMKKLAVFLTVSALLLGMTGSSQAFWWLFGQSKDGVSMSYLFINDTAFDESDDMITLYEDYLADGLVHIRGRAVASRSRWERHGIS